MTKNIKELIQLMKDNNITHLKMGDVELTMQPVQAKTLPPKKVFTPKERAVMQAEELYELASYSGNPGISKEDFVLSYLEPGIQRSATEGIDLAAIAGIPVLSKDRS